MFLAGRSSGGAIDLRRGPNECANDPSSLDERWGPCGAIDGYKQQSQSTREMDSVGEVCTLASRPTYACNDKNQVRCTMLLVIYKWHTPSARVGSRHMLLVLSADRFFISFSTGVAPILFDRFRQMLW